MRNKKNAKENGDKIEKQKGKRGAKDDLQALTDLCAEKQQTIGRVVQLLAEVNTASVTDPIGTCTLPTGGVRQTTHAECDSLRGSWSYDPDDDDEDKMHQELLRKMPQAAKQLNELKQISKDSAALLQKLAGMLEELNEKQPGKMVGVCRLPDGKCVPGTERECQQAGGVWSYVLPPPATKKAKS